MHDSELYGRTIRVNFARPPKITERNQRPVWADDEWLKQYGHGSGAGKELNDEDGVNENIEGSSTENGEANTKKALPRVFFGVKIGIRLVFIFLLMFI